MDVVVVSVWVSVGGAVVGVILLDVGAVDDVIGVEVFFCRLCINFGALLVLLLILENKLFVIFYKKYTTKTNENKIKTFKKIPKKNEFSKYFKSSSFQKNPLPNRTVQNNP